MAQQTLNLGAGPNDNTGDDLRTGGGKINDNFTELYARGYILPFFFTTTPTDGEVLLLHKAGADFTIPANFTAALESHVGTNPTGTFDLTVAQDGVTIGTISVSSGGVVTATTTSGAAKAIAKGDLITITGPGTADTTAANMAFTIIGER